MIPKFDEKTKTFSLANYEQAKAYALDYVKERGLQDVIIQDDSDFKAVKERRTEIRKKKEAIASARIALNKAVVGTLNEQLRSIEAILTDADGVLKSKVDEWKAKDEKSIEIYSVTISSLDKEKIEKIKKYAKRLGLEVR